MKIYIFSFIFVVSGLLIIFEIFPENQIVKLLHNNLLAIGTLFIALLSLFYSIQSFEASHRPYFIADTHSYADQNTGQVVTVLNVLRRIVLNAPARIISERYTIELNAKVLIAGTTPPTVLYPIEKSQATYTLGLDIQAEITKLKEGDLLRRKAFVKYSGLSWWREYSYEAVWVYNVEGSNWSIESTTID
jgi:hypothetical protein